MTRGAADDGGEAPLTQPPAGAGAERTKPNSPSGPEPEDLQAEPTFREAFGAAVRGAGIGQVAPGEIPTASSLLAAVGGVRGLVESILPGLTFLLLYSVTKNLALAVLVPVAIAIVFVVVRLVSGTPATQAFAGVAGVAISAGLALFTGRAEDNFLVGMVINLVSLAVLLVSLLVRAPLIGVLVGLLANEGTAWKSDAAKRRVLTLATILWCGLFTVRLVAEVPLYLTGQVELLGVVKLILGVPFYALMLWVTWLLVRAAYGREKRAVG